MAKLIKKGTMDYGDVTPDTGFPEPAASVVSKKVISGHTFDAKAEARGIIEISEKEAAAIIEDAHVKANQIIEEATAEGEQIWEQARIEGHEEGRQQGATALSEAVASYSRRLQQIETQAVPQLKELALSIARKILGKELEFAPDAVVDIVKQALAEKARQRREIYLRINPEDMDAIRENKADLLEVLSRCKEIGIREDPDVERYGVIIETDAGIIDAQLETQLAVFERILKNA